MKQLEDYRRDAWNCYRDSMCKNVFTWHIKSDRHAAICPSLMRYQFDAYSAQGRMDLARAMIEGELEDSAKLLDVAYRCQLCGGCDYICGRVKELQPGRVIQAMRAKLVEQGKGPPPEFKPLMQSLRQFQNPYKKANAERADWFEDLCQHEGENPSLSDQAQTENLLYIGCSPLRDPAAQAMPKAVAKILAKAGFNVGVLGARERCCGNPSLRIGDQNDFVAFATENIKMFNSMGVKKLICLCPFCYSTFRRDYPQVGIEMDFEVIHVLEVVSQLISEKRLKPTKKKDLTVTYHDPCHLGRISSDGVSGTGAFEGLYDAPRDILKALPGVDLVEMDRIKDDALCCGAGSWMKTAYPDFAEATALERIDEARTTHSEVLATHCPHCEENFSDAIKASGCSMKVCNVLELVLDAIEESDDG